MDLLKHADVYRRFAGQCTQCGHCTDACSSLTTAGLTLGQIAKGLLAAQRGAGSPEELASTLAADAQLAQAVRGCFFCSSCKNTCFAHNDVCDLIYHARVDYQELGLIPRDTWASVQVDQEWDIFMAYRAIHGIGYPDLTRHVANEWHDVETDCEVAFFPGCALTAYGPELTREVFAAIEELGGKTTMLDHCCGSPLKSAGFYERAEALLDLIAGEVRTSGARRVVCVCPGCANAMRETLVRNDMSDVAVESLPAFLVEHGFEPRRPLPATPLCLSKACQDRDGSYLEETCAALGIDPGTPTIFHGCCGAGGAVSSFSPERIGQQADGKLSFAPDGSTVITMCPTCTYTYAMREMNGSEQMARGLVNKHYAELLFESQFDWDTVFVQLGSMWYGEYGPWLAQVFA